MNANPVIDRTTVGTWPWDACGVKYNPCTWRDAWCEISEEHYYYCLEVLPPLYVEGGFAVSEPLTNDADGRAVYLVCAHVGRGYFARVSTKADAAGHVRALRDALSR